MKQVQPISILAVDDEPGVLALVRRCLGDFTREGLREAVALLLFGRTTF